MEDYSNILDKFYWFSTKLQNPTETGDYLATCVDPADGFKRISVEHYSVVYGEWYTGDFKVIGWLPLPKPYEGDDEPCENATPANTEQE